tara:strand:- start:132 stop:431 length:300 start_codon:yes stop_codon:yes gene_type:complete
MKTYKKHWQNRQIIYSGNYEFHREQFGKIKFQRKGLTSAVQLLKLQKKADEMHEFIDDYYETPCGEIEDRAGVELPGITASKDEIKAFKQAINDRPKAN